MANDKLGVLETMSALLRGRTEPKGVDSKSANSSSVVNNEENRVKSNLTSDEQSRLRRIAKIFGEEFGKIVEIGKYAQGTVAKRVSTIAPIRALGSMKDRVVSAAVSTKGTAGNIFSLKNILATLGTVAAGVLGWSLLPKDIQDKIKEVIGTVYHKVLDVVKDIFKDVDKDKLIKLAEIVGGALLALIGINFLVGASFNFLAEGIFAGALAIGALDLAIWGLSSSFKTFADTKWKDVELGFGALEHFGVAAGFLGLLIEIIGPGAIAMAALAGGIWALSSSFKTFADTKWKDVELGFGALEHFGVAAGFLGLLIEIIVPGAIAMAALAVGIGALGLALTPFAYAANLAAPAIDKIADSLVKLKDMPVSVLLAVGPALAAIGAGLAVFSSGSLFSSIIDGIGSLFGAKSPFDKIIELGKAAPGVEKLTNALKDLASVKDFNILGNLDVDKTIKNINNINEALWNLLGTQKKVNSEVSGTLTTAGDNNMQTLVSNTAEYNKFAKAALSEQIKRQDTMIDLLVQLVRKPVGGGSGASFNSYNNSYNTSSPENYRTDYNSQTLLA